MEPPLSMSPIEVFLKEFNRLVEDTDFKMQEIALYNSVNFRTSRRLLLGQAQEKLDAMCNRYFDRNHRTAEDDLREYVAKRAYNSRIRYTPPSTSSSSSSSSSASSDDRYFKAWQARDDAQFNADYLRKVMEEIRRNSNPEEREKGKSTP